MGNDYYEKGPLSNILQISFPSLLLFIIFLFLGRGENRVRFYKSNLLFYNLLCYYAIYIDFIILIFDT